ncbi:MAG: PSD1 and planctomycete cytochrome C domain-containing protein [Verrucomicrobiales bacterium]|nr:PSD1 and planctomycete cytochrome C domain-containing protein [Verrucomicrobiales bacterium]
MARVTPFFAPPDTPSREGHAVATLLSSALVNRLVPIALVSALRSLAVATTCVAAASAVSADAPVDFRREILPILSESCFHCHGPDGKERKADLRLDTLEGATADLGEGHSALVPGAPEKSTLLARIESHDAEEVMPPSDSGKTLTNAQKQTLRRWISEGAEYRAHWAFEEVLDVEPPVLEVEDSNLRDIDRFVVAALQERGLALSPKVSRAQLIRRATFDLAGLPPQWSEVEQFVNDPAPDGEAFEKVIDRLLASPAYGERWGRHWLDLARYADTHGGSAIGFQKFPFSYTYRDYVIAAFNADLPYDRFLLEQLAADQLKLDENDPALAALGFLTVGRQFRNVHDRLDDQIDVISRGLLGLTVSCARCHDHKFDPIPTTDYYALHAALSASTVPRQTELPLVGDSEVAESYGRELEHNEKLRDDMFREQGEVFRGRLRIQTGLYLQELARGVPEQDTSTTFLSYRTEDLRPVILERWRGWLKQHGDDDPVFGPWHQLEKLDGEDFETASQELVADLVKENGDPEKFAGEHNIGTRPPKWNPRVLDALGKRKPTSFVEVAEVYGEVFATAYRNWMTAQLEAALEAAPDGELVKDQDPKHRIVNSSIERQIRHHLYAADSPTMLSLEEDRHIMMLNRGVRDATNSTRRAITSLNLKSTAPPRAMVLRERIQPNRQSFVFLRGNPVQRGEKVEPRFLSAIAGGNPGRFVDGQRRLGLARAIVDPENPLTRRVIANWVWLHHFGRGLVRTADDFGTRGEPPSHPGLLDFLAAKLLEDDWSIKELHRRIMRSAVYQQAAIERPEAREKDPGNELLWRMPVQKLSLESMRDAMLAVSGELDREQAGGRPFEEKDDKAVPRRSVYAFVNRDVISTMAATFDGADPSACTVQRPETLVPQQTLFALNSEFIRGRAQALVAQKEIRVARSDEERLRLLYQRVYSRNPDAEEIRVGLEYLDDARRRGGDALANFAHALMASNEFHFVD